MTYRGRDSRDHLATFPTLAFIQVGVVLLAAFSLPNVLFLFRLFSHNP